MDLTTLHTRKQKLALDAKTILDEGKDGLTDEQSKQVDALFKEIESVDKWIVKLKGDQTFWSAYQQTIDGITDGKIEQHVEQHVERRLTRKSIGQEVIEHKAFKDVIELARRSRRFESDIIEVKAAPILVDSLVPAESLGQIVAPAKRLPVAALFAQGTTTGNSVTYNRETSFTNAAAAVAEGAAKPESEIVLAPIVEAVRKYAHWITASKEALDDVANIRSHIDNRLRYGLAFAIDNALLNGSATPPSLVGLLNRAGLSATVVQGAAPDTAVDAILRQAVAVEVASGLPADGVVIHPNDWGPILSGKDTQGQYYGNGPFASPTPNGPTLWGSLSVAVTTAIPENTVLVGSFKQGAMLAWRETMAVSISNAHSDYFVRNLLAVLIEARLAMLVTMPEAFGKVTLAAVE